MQAPSQPAPPAAPSLAAPQMVRRRLVAQWGQRGVLLPGLGVGVPERAFQWWVWAAEAQPASDMKKERGLLNLSHRHCIS